MITGALKSLSEKNKGWTKEDKEFLTPILLELGIEPPKKSSCPSCWRDCAILALVALKHDEESVANGFRLKGAAKRGVIWKGRMVSDATLDADMIDWLKKTGFPSNLWTDED